MAFLKARNGNIADRFERVAIEYMRHGTAMKIRWDQAFFQMLVETNYLSYKRGNGNWGDVKPSQNNFAGLGATGGGVPGERFSSVSDGVKAHLQHILMYAGEKIQDPVANRTRKVQEWGILDSWREGIGRPLTFTDLTKKWSPGDRGYSDDIDVTAKRFHDSFCSKADPHPEWVAEAVGDQTAEAKRIASAKAAKRLARQALARNQADEGNRSSGLGGQSLAAAGTVPFKILNAPDVRQAPPAVVPNAAPEPPRVEKAAAATAARQLPRGAIPRAVPQAKMKCNVFTASYGGQKAIIIKAIKNGELNYTVLDVNEGKEQRESEAYIAAYAKGGTSVGSFSSQSQALDKAFELCPEG